MSLDYGIFDAQNQTGNGAPPPAFYSADGSLQDPRAKRSIALNNTNCPGNVRASPASNIQNCRSRCLSDDDCQSWSYDRNNNNCYTNNNTPTCFQTSGWNSGRIINPAPWFGSAPGPSPAPSPSVTKISKQMNNVAFPVTGQSRNVYANSAAECQAAAMQGPWNGYSYNPNAQGPSCTLNRGQPQQLYSAPGVQTGQIYSTSSTPQRMPTLPMQNGPAPMQSPPGAIQRAPAQNGVQPWNGDLPSTHGEYNSDTNDSNGWQNIKQDVAPAWNGLKQATAPAWQGLKNTFAPIVGSGRTGQRYNPTVHNISHQIAPIN